MKTESIVFHDGAVALKGFFAYDESRQGKRPGIIVVHEAWGLVSHTMQRAKMLAELGYSALAVDMYGDGRVVTDIREAVGVVEELRGNPTKLRARARAALSALAELPNVDRSRLAAIGYCFGGSTVLELARDGADVSAVVSFHGGLLTSAPAEVGAVKASVLVCTGSDDPYAPVEHVQALEKEMNKAGADWQVISYGGTPHSFTNPDADGSVDPAIRYHERSDKRSWAAMKTFLDDAFST